MSANKPSSGLRALARLCGVAPSYTDFDNKSVSAPAATLVRFINELSGLALTPEADAKKLSAARTQLATKRRAQGLPPVLVAWDGALPPLWFWAVNPASHYTITARAEDQAESGWSEKLAVSEKFKRQTAGERSWRVNLGKTPKLPPGYYHLEIQDADTVLAHSFVISAPEKLGTVGKSWGAFAPVHALYGDQADHKGIGDLGDLKQACAMIGKEGGAFVGTLPLLAADYDRDTKDVSPYAPSSRLFWNEIYLDLATLPDVAPPSAPSLKTGELVDYAAVYAAKKKIVMAAAQEFFAKGGAEKTAYQAYRERVPMLDDYAAFHGRGDQAIENYHRYAQYACDAQLQAIAVQENAGQGAALYLDYPVGVGSSGFDAAQFKNLFLNQFQVGAPPDLFYAAGQNWCFQPLDPRAIIVDKFAYLRAGLHVYFAQARMVRLDHVMGFYRLYCIPAGEKATEGAYVYYPFAAMTAILCLEAHRHDAVLVGEDLGTVPDAVRGAMDRHHFNRMWLLPFEAKPDRQETFANVPAATIASFNTHDMFPYAAYRSESDILELERLNLIGADSAATIRKNRAEQWAAWDVGPDGYDELLDELAKSPAQYVMINIEDLWRETEPQNIPGTTDAYPNWRRRFRHGINEWPALPGARAAFNILQSTRSNSHG